MGGKLSNSFAKLLIFISIILIVCGSLLQIKDTTLVDLNNVVVLDDENNISITTTDQDVVTNGDNQELVDDNNEEVSDSKVPSNNDDKDTSNSSTSDAIVDNSNNASNSNSNSSNNNSANNSGTNNSSNNSSNNNSGNNSNSSSNSKPIVPNPPVLTIEETNLKLRDSIQSTYGVTIKYGSETSGYSVGGLTTTIISDASECQKALNDLNNALALYPSGFFNELSKNYNSLTFYLVKRYSKGSVTGVTESSSARTDISIAIDFGFGETFHHEVYHYVEYYMNAKGFYYTSWNTLNPVGFNYGSINQSYSYDSTFSDNAYFVNSYAQYSAAEDRASTFEYMMSGSKASCLNYGKVVWSKAKAMSDAIDYYLNSVSPNIVEYWERFVY